MKLPVVPEANSRSKVGLSYAGGSDGAILISGYEIED
jgi:hypothetical protein